MNCSMSEGEECAGAVSQRQTSEKDRKHFPTMEVLAYEYERHRKFWENKSPPDLADHKLFEYASTKKSIAEDSMLVEEYVHAVFQCTVCIAACPVNNKFLIAYAYFLRSLALEKLGLEYFSLMDINRSVLHDDAALFRRRQQDKIAQVRRARYDFGVTLTDPEIPVSDDFDLSNRDLPNSSPKLRLGFNHKYRFPFLEATEDIQPGEILCKEEFFAASLCPEFRLTVCAFCFTYSYALIPCPTCTQELYCSERCRKRAFDLYHCTECQIIGLSSLLSLSKDWIHVYTLALRAFLVGTDQGKKLPELIEKLPMNEIFKRNNVPPRLPFVNKYTAFVEWGQLRQFYSNEASLSLRLREIVWISTEIVVSLERLSFFGDQEGTATENRSNDMKLYSVHLINNHLLSLPLTSVPIYGKRGPTYNDLAIVGSSAYIFNNFFKGGCYGNTQPFMKNGHLYMYAMRPIKAGEQLVFAREPHLFARKPFEKRNVPMVRLFPYNADGCQCDACVGKWPLLKDVVKFKSRFKNTYTRQMLLDSIEYVAKRQPGSTEQMNNTELLRIVIDILKLLHDHLQFPCWAIMVWEGVLIRIMNTVHSSCLRDENIESLFRTKLLEVLNMIEYN